MDEATQLHQLEESLWRAETRFDRAHMESVLAPGFFEFGRSGRVHTRTEILELEATSIGARLPLAEFAVWPVADDVRLVTYLGEVYTDTGIELSNRSSLWVRTPSGWRLRFHQGTPRQG